MVSLFIKCNIVLVCTNVVVVVLYAVLVLLWCEILLLHIILILVHVIAGSVWIALMVFGELKKSIKCLKLSCPLLIPFNMYLLGILVVANAKSICGKDVTTLALRIPLSAFILPQFLFNVMMRYWVIRLRRKLELEVGISEPTFSQKVHDVRHTVAPLTPAPSPIVE